MPVGVVSLISDLDHQSWQQMTLPTEPFKNMIFYSIKPDQLLNLLSWLVPLALNLSPKPCRDSLW